MTNLLQVMKFHSMKECYYSKCHAKFPNGLIELTGRWDDGTLKYKPAKLLFHLQDTHGMPHEIVLEELEKLFNSEMTQDQVDQYNQIMKQGLRDS